MIPTCFLGTNAEYVRISKEVNKTTITFKNQIAEKDVDPREEDRPFFEELLNDKPGDKHKKFGYPVLSLRFQIVRILCPDVCKKEQIAL